MVKKRTSLLIFSLAGVLNGIWMLILHLRYDKLGGVCSINEKISCEVLTYKQYSEWFGIPTPLYALFVFVVLFVLAISAWKKKSETPVIEDGYVWILSTISLLSAIAMAYISFIVLKKLCVFCFLYYIIIIGTWILATKIASRRPSSLTTTLKTFCSRFYENKWFWITGILFVSTLAIAKVTLPSGGALSNETVEIRGDEVKTTGNPNAKLTLVIFSDFQCPACKRASEILKQLEDDYSSKMKVVYKFFPLDPECNPGAPYGRHLMACDAAKAALCAGQQGKFWRYHDHLFAEQETLYDRKFTQFAEDEGLDMRKFQSCFESSQAKATVTKDADEGNNLHIDATPTMFFNGKKYTGQIKLEDIKKMIDSLL